MDELRNPHHHREVKQSHDSLRAFALQNMSEARAMLEAARSNYSAARKLLRSVAPEEYQATESLSRICARPGHSPTSARAKRSELIEMLVSKNWSLRRSPERNLDKAEKEGRHLGLWGPNSDSSYSLCRAAVRLGLCVWEYETKRYVHPHERSGLGAPSAA